MADNCGGKSPAKIPVEDVGDYLSGSGFGGGGGDVQKQGRKKVGRSKIVPVPTVGR